MTDVRIVGHRRDAPQGGRRAVAVAGRPHLGAAGAGLQQPIDRHAITLALAAPLLAIFVDHGGEEGDIHRSGELNLVAHDRTTVLAGRLFPRLGVF
jgi:hypothetical protein